MKENVSKKELGMAQRRLEKAFWLIDEAMTLLGIDSDSSSYIGNLAWSARLDLSSFETEVKYELAKKEEAHHG